MSMAAFIKMLSAALLSHLKIGGHLINGNATLSGLFVYISTSSKPHSSSGSLAHPRPH